MIKRKFVSCILALIISTKSAFALIRDYNSVTEWTPDETYEFEDDGCVIGFWYNEKVQLILKIKISKGFTPFEMLEKERPGSLESGWNHFTMSKIRTLRNGKILIQKPLLIEQVIIEKIIDGLVNLYDQYFFIRLK